MRSGRRVHADAWLLAPESALIVRSFITGASGFVGGHLRAHLESMGDDIVASEVDITDRQAILDEVAKSGADSLYHLAAQADVGGSWDRPAETVRVNVEGTLNVLDAARLGGVERVVAITSADVYGRAAGEDLPLDENTPIRPVSPYAASKAAADILCLQAALGHGLHVIRVRSFNHLGPGQSDRFVASALASRVVANELSGGEVVRVGNLEARRDFTDVRDVVRAYRLLMQHGAAGEVYHVCSGVDRAVSELAEHLIAAARLPMRLEVDPELFRPIDVAVLRGDPSKTNATTGWSPEIEISQTLDDLLDYWRSVQSESNQSN